MNKDIAFWACVIIGNIWLSQNSTKDSWLLGLLWVSVAGVVTITMK